MDTKVRNLRRRKNIAGFTLIEVLVAILVLAIGLLGMAGLQGLSVRNSQSAYQRTQAAILAHSLVDEMRANPTQEFSGFVASTFSGSADCISTTANCDAATLATFAKQQWKSVLVSTLSGADAEVSKSNDIYTVEVQWKDKDGTEASLSVKTEL